MKLFAVILFLAVVASGCTTKSKARLNQQKAFLEGQNAALRQAAAQNSVTVLGAVQNKSVPFVAGLTLAQAIATANYLGAGEPKQIVITRQGESAAIDPKTVLSGVAIPLEAGDVIELR